ncbi:aspartate--tRNA ligase [Candidatus Phytoplasma pini]|uniref:Aspartate--tRNA ligase n=1 Tax=Candidatus Phytoplasma pini TaxID=267362 RepID=A0A559KJE2_9MOLU|nr:aspartate--tRNA ligase [Candidatus Phytoplasma pini]TVY12229.1 Aspartyl-tRNA synthetase [Candidatus Phytoplasma pini]
MKIKYNEFNSDISLKQKGNKVLLKGWIARKRNLGNKMFLILRDISGFIQLLIKNNHPQYQQVSLLKVETVIDVQGLVIERINKNKNLKNGDIEILVEKINVLSESQQLPLNVFETTEISEEYRLRYRYLDLRREDKKKYLLQRHAITQNIRQTLLKNYFFELETPILCKSTPEGARDFLVPSRIYPKYFYALPQSPQIFKQLYMIAGFERYFQFARCFRDEDLRSDRQPEFTQIDIETSFFSQKEIMTLTEEIIVNLFHSIKNKSLKSPFFQMDYEEAINLYGTDKPDLRFSLFIEDLTSYFNSSFLNQDNESEIVLKGIKIKKDDVRNKKKLYNSVVNEYKRVLKEKYQVNLFFLTKTESFTKGYLSKFIIDDSFLANDESCFLLILNAKNKNLFNQSLKALGFLRNKLGKYLDLIDSSKESLLWIVNFPLLEFSEKEQRYYALHHPFTSPSDLALLGLSPDKVKAKAYDLVWNGYEIGGGSLRIHQYHIQELIFKKLGFSVEEIQKKFGFFVEALKYGTPPHGGIALGLDRLVMMFTKTNNIKDVIAFPKTQSAKDLMLETPSQVDEEQLLTLKIK